MSITDLISSRKLKAITNRFVFFFLERERDLLFSAPALDRSPLSRAYLSGRKRESDANNFLGAVSKLFILCAKYVY